MGCRRARLPRTRGSRNSGRGLNAPRLAHQTTCTRRLYLDPSCRWRGEEVLPHPFTQIRVWGVRADQGWPTQGRLHPKTRRWRHGPTPASIKGPTWATSPMPSPGISLTPVFTHAALTARQSAASIESLASRQMSASPSQPPSETLDDSTWAMGIPGRAQCPMAPPSEVGSMLYTAMSPTPDSPRAPIAPRAVCPAPKTSDSHIRSTVATSTPIRPSVGPTRSSPMPVGGPT